jgi:hypothetical protein
VAQGEELGVTPWRRRRPFSTHDFKAMHSLTSSSTLKTK